MWQGLAIALCLVLVLEGVLLFLCLRRWRDALLQPTQLFDRRLGLIGLASMLLGATVLYWLH
ncbi:DUF2065 family protein [uncultured Pseudomonas sp.]|jgi:uncharacterized protein|uniref:DUF2065 family protein n=1 Tax=uncultured Pseudomonas sp. TaxID=114707 RepID=UPI00260BDD22|nr:DUF2065 family protein [uncultured Pseudomonas sp.]